jgi:type I restriction-modification system DNA methylase subunit
VLQTRLPVIQVSSEKKENLDKKLDEIYQNIKNRFKVFGTFQDVLTNSANYSSSNLKDEQAPEEFTKRTIIEPLIDLLGFEIVPETVLPSPGGRKEPDYIIRPKNQQSPVFYMEAEPLNTDLHSKGKGVWQVNDWLLSRASKTDYGIATDGFTWILLKFDIVSAQSKEVLKVNLSTILIRKLNPTAFISDDDIERAKSDFLTFDCEYISHFLEGYLEIIEKEKEEISKRFYSDYVRYVFGYDEAGNAIKGVSLFNKVVPPSATNDNDMKLFSVIFMNRIMFIRFLEEKRIVPKDLLKNLMDRYKSSGTPSTFYDTYLKPLFYDVFNKGKESRPSAVKSNPFYAQIPYLNGGLFREVVGNEGNYTIENEGVQLVIENLLEKYSFGLDSGINPDILGYIFEKTINFISGTGTNQQKMEGAYYTPDDVVEFIIDQTLTPIIFNKMIEGLKKAGWNDVDLKGYNSIEDIMDPQNIPKNPIHIKKMIESLETIKVLDPACGSGHFLTAMLSQILRVKEDLLITIKENIERYKLKRDIISQNLFGVDIDKNAVEIARLRLWLSIIEEVEDPQHVDTLPNIDFNIFVGNSLIGWFDENLLMHPLVGLLDDPDVQSTLHSLGASYGTKIDEVEERLRKNRLDDTIEAYRTLSEIYASESGERAVKIREILENIRNKLYEVINRSYLDFINRKGNLNKKIFYELGKNISNRMPFHWRIDFEHIIKEGGFDTIVGNPPYIEDRNYNMIDLEIIKCMRKGKKKVVEPLFFYSISCGNTYAYFIERSIELLKQNGKFGFIVPIALVSTDRMDDVREIIYKNSSEVKYYNFDDRPGKIFSGIEDCRSTIVITKKGTGVDKITTSKYHRWYTRDRPKVFKNLQTSDWYIVDPKGIVPKIGTNIEKAILNKLDQKSKGKTVENFVEDIGVKIWYHNAPRYWIHAHPENYLPSVEYYENYETNTDTGEVVLNNLKEKQISSHYKPLIFAKESFDGILGLLNSSLFYWWFIVWSDGRDLLADHIHSFPIDIKNFPDNFKEKLKLLVNGLMENYDKTSNIKINVRSGGYAIKIKEIIPSKSKNIIDQIDEIFADYFGFTEDERKFIREFDIEFRIKSES